MRRQQAVDDVGGGRQLGYQGVPLIHDHSTWTREVNRGSVRARVKSSPDSEQLHCRSWPGPRLEQTHGCNVSPLADGW